METRKTNHIHSMDPMQSVNNVDDGMTHTRTLMPGVTFHPGPTYSPLQKPIRSNVPRNQESSQSSPSPENISSDINLDFEENIHHFKKMLFQKLIKDWTNHSFKNHEN